MTEPTQDLLQGLAAIFAQEPSAPVDVAGLLASLDPGRCGNGWRMPVALLKCGASPAEVWALLDTAQQQALLAVNPDMPAPPPIESETSAAPALPEAAHVSPELAKDACTWLDSYTAFSSQWSPRAFDGFHEACGLWLLSTVAARRVRLHFGGPRYTNLSIALAARTSLWAKSTTTKIGMDTLAAAGLDWLLAGDATPQKFVADLAARLPVDFDNLDGGEQKRALLRVAFAAQRGWFYEEFGQKVHAMMREGGFMADFRGILRQFDDCPDRYEYSTIGRGTDLVKAPYLALLANLTPADLRSVAKRNDSLWNDGFWARFAFVTPPAGANDSKARFPRGPRVTPAHIVTPLRAWHDRLGQPEVEVESELDEEGRPTGRKHVHADPLPVTTCEMGRDVEEAFYGYHDALTDLVGDSGNEDLDGNYARFAEKALRIAMLLASLENDNAIELRHWYRAQLVTERWRGYLHALYAQVNSAGPSEEAENEDRVYRIVEKLDSPTPADVARYIRGMSSQEAARILDGLAYAGRLVREDKTRRGTYHYSVQS